MIMNKLIKEFIKQCSTTFDSYDFEYGWSTHEYFDKEKFAELIVRECVGICECEWNGDAATFATSEAYNECADAIKEHFGVEE
jgi:hypothetical protein